MKAKIPIHIGFATFVVLIGAIVQTVAQHPLDSWGRRSVPGPNTNLNSVAFGNGLFVTVGNGSFVARSTDGITWTPSIAGGFGNLVRVRFLNGQFVAVGTSDKMVSSTDGVSWTANTLPATGFWDIAFGNGVYVLAGAATYVSSDGVGWTPTHPMQNAYSGFPAFETPLDTVVFGNGGFLGLPSGGARPWMLDSRKGVFSPNGVDWVSGASAPSSSGGGLPDCELLYAEGAFMATTQTTPFGIGMLGNLHATTNNGATWYDAFVPVLAGDQGLALSFGQGHYVSVHRNRTFAGENINMIFSSTDRINWESRYEEEVRADLREAAFGNGAFVVVGWDESNTSYILQSGNLSGAPSVFQEPQDRGAVAMNPATFSVQAVGAPTLTYQWYKNGNAIANETNTSYTIANVQTGDSGGYHVVVANSLGSVTSRVAQLTVAFLDINCFAGITVLGVPGRIYRIDATSASGPPDWQTVTNLVLPSSPYIWIDYESPKLPTRLYRAAESP